MTTEGTTRVDSMDNLPSDCKDWSLESDKQLLAALQQFSASFLSRVSDVEASLNDMMRDAGEAEIRATIASNRFRLLAHKQFVEQARYLSYIILLTTRCSSNMPLNPPAPPKGVECQSTVCKTRPFPCRA
jgi:hypothetical protein